MKKLLFALLLVGLLSSCVGNPVPIEKHKGAVMIEKRLYNDGYQLIELKCKDSIYKITVTIYDSDRFNIGDTIK